MIMKGFGRTTAGPLIPAIAGLDTTLHYQAVINPSLDHTNDFASVFSLRFTTGLPSDE